MSFAEKLASLQDQGRFRKFSPHTRRGGNAIEQDGKNYLNLSSNDYLGLAGNVSLQRRFYENVGLEQGFFDTYGLGSASSRLLSGDYEIAHELERALARAYGQEAALLFNSGYHANIGILPALAGKGDLILSDKLNHASIHDGLQLSRADHKRYSHCDYGQLRSILEKNRDQYKRVFIISESIFSMDGDVADIAELVRLKEEFNCLLLLDEAHGVGLYGKMGLGKAAEAGLHDKVDIILGTFGKSYASVGAFAICSGEIRDYLINHSRSLIFTTALPAINYAWSLHVFEHSLGLDHERAHLQTLSENLRDSLVASGLKTAGSTNIVPVIIGEDSRAVALATKMQAHGFMVLPVRPPTVPAGTSRFRLSLSASMTWAELENIATTIVKISQDA